MPDGLDPALAVCLGVAGLAALAAARVARRACEPGETVLVLGASGVVGQIAVQAAQLLGAGRVVAAARSEEGLERARELGADATVPLGDATDLPAALREAAGGDGFDVVLDPLWGEPALAALTALRAVRAARAARPVGRRRGDAPLGAVRAKPVDIRGYTNYTAGEERKAAAYARMAGPRAGGRDARLTIERVGPRRTCRTAWQRQARARRIAKLVDRVP